MLTVKTPIQFKRNTTILAGATLSDEEALEILDAEQITALKKCGALAELSEVVAPDISIDDQTDGDDDVSTTDNGDGDDTNGEITLEATIKQMLDDDPAKANGDWWTNDGEPDVHELRRRLKRNISAAERSEAWAPFATPDA